MDVQKSGDEAVVVVDTNSWVATNKKGFVPPVCNKCMFSDFLKVFFVGGPNSRDDYHIEEGEELFYQIKGDMVLKVIEDGVPKDVRIKEGQVFLLPARVQHSPQRFEGTLGCVVERERKQDEFDCVRYFVKGKPIPTPLWERWFHLNDVVKDLPPVIKEFNESQEKFTNTPGDSSFTTKAAFKPSKVELVEPITLSKFINENIDKINASSVVLFKEQSTSTSTVLLGKGEHNLDSGNTELLLLFERGQGTLKYGSEEFTVPTFNTVRIKPNSKATLTITDGICLTFKFT
ncbi:unnamed protein product [Bursaphelenchus okinawaensis]|uniref:3-hydroxyanthranilate 3,4-dioxygenase n=1 Tax=Bursaphelenchus okinawaensis TaxID=465554 RepID=A0A811L9V7_9BILA|nr:unnamed protein product [Bursaphelenchus okinawaensis]CAG9119183.1 unnamed protein product [Bursaphelenchus okinawaensis]